MLWSCTFVWMSQEQASSSWCLSVWTLICFTLFVSLCFYRRLRDRAGVWRMQYDTSELSNYDTCFDLILFSWLCQTHFFLSFCSQTCGWSVLLPALFCHSHFRWQPLSFLWVELMTPHFHCTWCKTIRQRSWENYATVCLNSFPGGPRIEMTWLMHW